MRVNTTLLAAYVVVIGSFVLTRPATADQGYVCSECFPDLGMVLLYCEDAYGSQSGPGVYGQSQNGDNSCGLPTTGLYEFDCESCPGA